MVDDIEEANGQVYHHDYHDHEWSNNRNIIIFKGNAGMAATLG